MKKVQNTPVHVIYHRRIRVKQLAHRCTAQIKNKHFLHYFRWACWPYLKKLRLGTCPCQSCPTAPRPPKCDISYLTIDAKNSTL